MNESFLLRFKRGNTYWTVTDVSAAQGITFDELASATQTDHLALWKDLKKTAAGDYLFYKVV